MLSLSYDRPESEHLPAAQLPSPVRSIIATLATMGAAAAAVKLLLQWYVDGWDKQPIEIDGDEPERHFGKN